MQEMFDGLVFETVIAPTSNCKPHPRCAKASLNMHLTRMAAKIMTADEEVLQRLKMDSSLRLVQEADDGNQEQTEG
jgi:hypothetical protein